MSPEEVKPCADNLSAMPGDMIDYFDPGTGAIVQAVVQSAGWLPGAKSGKVWTYWTNLESTVHADLVTKVTKRKFGEQKPVALEYKEELETVYDLQHLMLTTERSALSTSMKTVIHCIVQGDPENLDVAAFLLKDRARQLRELENVSLTTTFPLGGNHGR